MAGVLSWKRIGHFAFVVSFFPMLMPRYPLIGFPIGPLAQGFSNFWCCGAHEEIDHNL